MTGAFPSETRKMAQMRGWAESHRCGAGAGE